MRSNARLWAILATVVMLGTFVGVCLAAEVANEFAKLAQASGDIASVDVQGGVLTIKESAATDPAVASSPTRFLVDANTVVRRDQQSLKLTDLQVGETVTIEYATKDGNNVASSIAIISPAAANQEQTAAAPSAK